jgi:prepilin-type N-terminal cleavage/methylation domain-containing protein
MNKAIPYSNGNSGFTLMETLASITIILIISGCIYIAFSTSVKTILRARRTADTALMILMIDRFIRDETNNFHIPYWVDASSHSDAFRNYLWGSPYGRYISQF